MGRSVGPPLQNAFELEIIGGGGGRQWQGEPGTNQYETPHSAAAALSIGLSLGLMVAKEAAELPGSPKRPQTCRDTLGWTNGVCGEPVTPQLQTCARWPRMAGMRYMAVRVAHVVLERVQTGASVYSKRLGRSASRPFTSIHDGFAV